MKKAYIPVLVVVAIVALVLLFHNFDVYEFLKRLHGHR